MSLKTFSYLCRLGFKNTWRNKVYTIASVVTMTVCIFLFGLFYLVVLNVNTAIRNTEKDVAVVIFFDDNVPAGRVDEIGELLRARPEVTNTVYTSSEEAWNTFRDTYYEGENLLEGVFEEDNPLEHSNNYKVFLKDVESQEKFVAYVGQLDGVRSVRNSADTVKAVLKIKNAISTITFGSVVVIVLTSVLLIYNTLAIGIAAQREKTQAMLLMGARDIFIKIPFIIEGLIMGIAGMVLPIVLLYFTYRWGTEFAVTQFHLFGEGIRLLPLPSVFPGVVRACAAVGILSGCLGSMLAMGRLKR
ncbi:permease-like cell division protein FtsX [[Clostridium] symbiosum]|uniref:permease-like cell division protein FtsX n=1 Tax=Clostridium symbiosum TaxID=1512 RepID=UPI001D07F098|nr:permease-like cell division protein FtsX [[Clostridium] symbiosum]MCB6609820.1 ABC transporter permease [[Clostridium] symbiosum]MCB6931224.1 ABC transporter permease [[Clostridium] symbiosum]